MTEAIKEAATAVIAYWDSLWAVPSDDARPTEYFRDELDRRLDVLRETLERP